MIEVQGRGRLKGRHLASLGVHTTHDVLDRAVFPRGIHGLKNQQDRPLVLGIEPLLELREQLDPLLERLPSRLFVGGEILGVTRVDLLEPEAVAVMDPIGLSEVLALLQNLAQVHQR